MTDYIEWLLGLWEEEDQEEGALDITEPGAPSAAGAEIGAAERDGAAVPAPDGRAGSAPDGPREQGLRSAAGGRRKEAGALLPAPAGGGKQGRGAEAPLPYAPAVWSVQSAAAEEKAEVAAAFYGALRRARHAAGQTAPPGGGTVGRKGPEPTAARPVAPADLDRIFERDARRYDGGFSLF
ncbi:MAG: hypothetical protein GX585_03750 [Clostridiales bacterium]|nr:hypothetical protein [Clostridiales bacterium]